MVLIRVSWLAMLGVDHHLAVLGVQLAAREHIAVERIAVDGVVVEISLGIIERHFPELGHRRHVIHVEVDRVAMLTRERPPV